MKKIKLLCLCLLMVMGCTITSCSSIVNPDPEEVMEKINSGEALDEADYATMVDYINDFCDEADASDGSYEAGQEAVERYPYFMAFGLTLANAVETTPDEIGDKAEAKNAVNRLMNVMNR